MSRATAGRNLSGLVIPATGCYWGADDDRGFTNPSKNGIEDLLHRRMAIRNRHYFLDRASVPPWPGAREKADTTLTAPAVLTMITHGSQGSVFPVKTKWDGKGHTASGDASTVAGHNGLDRITNGEWDAYYRDGFRRIKALGVPVLFRLWQEFNIPAMNAYAGFQGGTGGAGQHSYIAAWRHLHGLAAAVGATNMIWVWCPTFFDPDKNWGTYYPGRQYVDVLGLDLYRHPFKGNADPWYRTAVAEGLPFGIMESGFEEGSIVSGMTKAQLVAEARQSIQGGSYDECVFFVHWNSSGPGGNDHIDTSAASLRAYQAFASDPYYSRVRGGGSPPPPPPPPPPVEDPITVLVAGDTGNGVPTDTTAYADKRRTSGTAHLAIIIGDLVEACPEDTANWQGKYAAHLQVLEHAPDGVSRWLYPAPGNHEYGHDAGTVSGGHACTGGIAVSGYTTRLVRQWPTLRDSDGDLWETFDLPGRWTVFNLCGVANRANTDNLAPLKGRYRTKLDQAFAAARARDRLALITWHEPRYCTPTTHHQGEPLMQPLWDLIGTHLAGRAVVLHGHQHLYERSAPIDALGRPTGSDQTGVRQFVVGTGGATIGGYTSAKAFPNGSHVQWAGKDPGGTGFPACRYFDVRDAGWLELNLRTDGYDYRFCSVHSPARNVDEGSVQLKAVAA